MAALNKQRNSSKNWEEKTNSGEPVSLLNTQPYRQGVYKNIFLYILISVLSEIRNLKNVLKFKKKLSEMTRTREL
jgi:hypothetical protein